MEYVEKLIAAGRPDLAEQLHIIPVGYLQVGAGFGKQALSVRAGSFFSLFLTGGSTEIGRGTSHIVNIAFEVRL